MSLTSRKHAVPLYILTHWNTVFSLCRVCSYVRFVFVHLLTIYLFFLYTFCLLPSLLPPCRLLLHTSNIFCFSLLIALLFHFITLNVLLLFSIFFAITLFASSAVHALIVFLWYKLFANSIVQWYRISNNSVLSIRTMYARQAKSIQPKQIWHCLNKFGYCANLLFFIFLHV